ncbi:hypothetical protein N656DRAFT_519057 [Canariomyces notabilis]|uniref:Uncharacterized protein n=1 Tax=Canariomyces notabilis TaxID=2074819 RepID=A0AAN6T7T0_9PEZI|nr:hypothetical protein N656DRAFT_519057 [Canariomyces arenarius]
MFFRQPGHAPEAAGKIYRLATPESSSGSETSSIAEAHHDHDRTQAQQDYNSNGNMNSKTTASAPDNRHLSSLPLPSPLRPSSPTRPFSPDDYLSSLHPCLVLTRDATPWPHAPSPNRNPRPFLILTHTSNATTDINTDTNTAVTTRALTLTDGALRLLPVSPASVAQGSWYWRCVENAETGWLGLCNVASGTYLGHDCFGNVRATQPHHRGWEYICLRRCPGPGGRGRGGGYVMDLVVADNNGGDGYGRLMRVAEAKGEEEEEEGRLVLVDRRDHDGGGDGVVWEFVEVGLAC